MKYYTGQHQYDCGVDLHARTMYLCIVNQADEILYHKEIPTKADLFLEKLAPYREDVVVSVECIGWRTCALPRRFLLCWDTRSL